MGQKYSMPPGMWGQTPPCKSSVNNKYTLHTHGVLRTVY